MENLKKDLKRQIIEVLNLEDLTVEDITDDAPLFGGEIGLDSIDALELIVMLENVYGVKLNNPEVGKQVFHSINSLATFIEENKK